MRTTDRLPRWRRVRCLAGLLALRLGVGLAAHVGAADDPGEFHLPPTPPLAPAQRARLRARVAGEPEAAAQFAALRAQALPLLEIAPTPVAVIAYEGLLNTDPRRIACVARLRSLADVATVLRYWQATEDPAAAAPLRRQILAWATTYVPTGNDVNENKLYPLFVAYAALRPDFPAGERVTVDAWIERLGTLAAAGARHPRAINNRFTKHLRLCMICGQILDRRDWRTLALAGLKCFVAESIHADGSTSDLRSRDSLTYHASALRPLLELALLAGAEGDALYRWTAPGGGSIEKAVHLVVPYASGEKVRAEWRHSQASLDRRRAEAGIAAYQPGRPYDPADAIPLLSDAACFDPALLPLVLKLRADAPARGDAWAMLVNAALR